MTVSAKSLLWPRTPVSLLLQALKARCQAVVRSKGKNIPRD